MSRGKLVVCTLAAILVIGVRASRASWQDVCLPDESSDDQQVAEINRDLDLPVDLFDITAGYCLQRHNYYRRLHSAPDLNADGSPPRLLLAHAQKMAQDLALYGKINATNSMFGLNWGYTQTRWHCSALVDLWMEGIKDYDFQSEEGNKFNQWATQIIWASTKQLACVVTNKVIVDTDPKTGQSLSRHWIVCAYDPKGNQRGQYRFNVSPRV